jgi:hypothetical protein
MSTSTGARLAITQSTDSSSAWRCGVATPQVPPRRPRLIRERRSRGTLTGGRTRGTPPRGMTNGAFPHALELPRSSFRYSWRRVPETTIIAGDPRLSAEIANGKSPSNLTPNPSVSAAALSSERPYRTQEVAGSESS